MIELETTHYPLNSMLIKVMSEDDLLDYLSIFPSHSISLSEIEPYQFVSHHKYEDGLCIQVVWKKPLAHLNFSEQLTMQDLGGSKMNGLIRLLHVRVLKESPSTTRVSLSASSAFFRQFYHCFPEEASEFLLSEHTTLPDIFFENLQERSQNTLSFYNYLQNTQPREDLNS